MPDSPKRCTQGTAIRTRSMLACACHTSKCIATLQPLLVPNDQFSVVIVFAVEPPLLLVLLCVPWFPDLPVRSHYISPQQFASNMQAIMDAAKRAGVTKFLIITPPPVCEACKAKSPVRKTSVAPGAAPAAASGSTVSAALLWLEANK